jgi:hypothetical protein
MTQEEINKKTSEKVNAIQTLCNQLEISITAEQAITDRGIIKNTIFYSDLEKYKLDEPEEDNKLEKQNDKKNRRNNKNSI